MASLRCGAWAVGVIVGGWAAVPATGEPVAVEVLLRDSVGATRAAAVRVFDRDGQEIEAEHDGDRVLLEPGTYTLSSVANAEWSAEVQVGAEAMTATIPVENSLWIMTGTRANARTCLMPLKSRAEMRSVIAGLRPSAEGWLLREVRCWRRAGVSDAEVSAAVRRAWEVVDEVDAEIAKNLKGDTASQRWDAAVSAARVLGACGSRDDERRLGDLLAAPGERSTRGYLMAALAMMEARHGTLAGGRVAALAADPRYTYVAPVLLSALGAIDPEPAWKAGLDGTSPGFSWLSCEMVRHADRPEVLGWYRDLVRGKDDATAFADSSDQNATVWGVLALLAFGGEEDWKVVAGQPLSAWHLARMGVLARDARPLAEAIAPTRRFGALRALIDGAANEGEEALRGAMRAVAEEMGKAGAEPGEAWEDTAEYRWMLMIMSSVRPTWEAASTTARAGALVREGVRTIGVETPWLLLAGDRKKAAELLAARKSREYWDILDHTPPAVLEAASAEAKSGEKVYAWDLALACQRVTSREGFTGDCVLPGGVDRRAFMIQAEEGVISGVAEVRGAWREGTLRLGVRLHLVGVYINGGGFIDFHQGDITDYGHWASVTDPWNHLASVELIGEGGAVPLVDRGLDSEGYLVLETGGAAAPTPTPTDLRGLNLTVVLKHHQTTMALTFDLALSAMAQEQRVLARRVDHASGLQRAEMLARLGRLDEAERVLVGAATTDERGGALEQAAQWRAEAGDLDGASARVGEVARLVPTNAAAWFNAGAMAYRAERYRECVAAIERALTLDPDDGRARTLRSRATLLSGAFEPPGADWLRAGEDEAFTFEQALVPYASALLRAQGLSGEERGKAARSAREVLRRGLRSIEREGEVDFASVLAGQGDGAEWKKCPDAASRCRLRCATGLAALAEGDVKRAKAEFALCVATRRTGQLEHRIALLALRRLGE